MSLQKYVLYCLKKFVLAAMRMRNRLYLFCVRAPYILKCHSRAFCVVIIRSEACVEVYCSFNLSVRVSARNTPEFLEALNSEITVYGGLISLMYDFVFIGQGCQGKTGIPKIIYSLAK